MVIQSSDADVSYFAEAPCSLLQCTGTTALVGTFVYTALLKWASTRIWPKQRTIDRVCSASICTQTQRTRVVSNLPTTPGFEGPGRCFPRACEPAGLQDAPPEQTDYKPLAKRPSADLQKKPGVCGLAILNSLIDNDLPIDPPPTPNVSS